MKKLLAVSAAVAAMLVGRVSAQEVPDQQKYFTVDPASIMIEEITDKGGTIPAPGELPMPPSGPVINPPLHPPSGPAHGPSTPAPTDPMAGFNNGVSAINSAVGVVGNIVNLAQKIWNIIEANQPVVNITTNYANAVPFGTSHWTQLQGWSKPATRKYAFSVKNSFGSEVVKITYQVHYTYKGNFQGKGKFLTGVTIEPLSVTTAWGYKVNLVSEVPDSTIANVGTSEDPIASMQLQLRWTVHNAFKDIQQKAIYYVRGDGALQEIGTPFKNAQAAKLRQKTDAMTLSVASSSFN